MMMGKREKVDMEMGLMRIRGKNMKGDANWKGVDNNARSRARWS